MYPRLHTRLHIAVIIVFLVSFGSVLLTTHRVTAADSTAVAKIVDFRLPASIRGLRAISIIIGAELHYGDTVMVSQGGSITLVFQDGAVKQFEGSAVIALSEKQEPKEGFIVKLATGLASALFKGKTTVEKARLAVRAATSTQTPSLTIPILSQPPSGTILLAAPAQLEWLPIDGATHYSVSLYDHERVIWMDHTKNAVIALPPDSIRLRPGESYIWIVQAEIENTVLRSEQASFELLDTLAHDQIIQALKEINSSGSDPRLAALLRLSLYQSHNLMVEETREIEALLKERPDDYAALVAKAALCEAMSKYREAAACYREALQR